MENEELKEVDVQEENLDEEVSTEEVNTNDNQESDDDELSAREKYEFYKRDLKTLLIYCTIGWTVAFIGFVILNINNSLLWILPITMIPAAIICIIPVYKKISRGHSIKGVWVDVERVTTYEDGHKTREADFSASLGATLLGLIPVIIKSIVCVFMLPFLLVHRALKVFKLSKELEEKKEGIIYLALTGAAAVYFIVGLVLWGTGSTSGLGTGRKVKDDYKGQNDVKKVIINDCKEYMINHNHESFTSYYEVKYDKNTKTYTMTVKDPVNFDSSYSKVIKKECTYTIDIETKTMVEDGVDITTIYSGNELEELKRDLTYVCPILALPFDIFITDPDNLAIKKVNTSHYEVKYSSKEHGEYYFTIWQGQLGNQPENSIGSYTLKDSILGYAIHY